jgi:hypothetical protein
VTTPAPPVDLDEVKEHLNIAGTTQDFELASFVQAAITRLEHEVGPLTPRSFTEMHPPGRIIALRKTPVVSVESITGTTLTVWDLDTSTALIYPRAPWLGFYGFGRITVTYTAGFVTVPADVRMALLELVRHLWTTQRGTVSANGARADLLPSSGGDPTTAAGIAAYTMPYRVLEMIRPYVRPSSVA